MSTTLSLNEIQRRCAKMVSSWKDEPGEERQQGQSFVRDLLATFGIRRTKAALYERRARRSSTGRQGYIDALLPGLCLIEMKSRGKDLVEAENQALDYIDSLPNAEQPRWVVTSDFGNIRVLDLYADSSEESIQFPLGYLQKNAKPLAFLAGYQNSLFGNREQERASIAAAQLMGDLYAALEGTGYDDHEASVFLVRTLFSLYADNSGIWEPGIYFEFLESRTSEDGTDLGPKLAQLYQVMNQPVERRQRNLDEFMKRFPYVNGGIFGETLSIPAFDSSMRNLLLEACASDWSGISPAIFGSLFQAVKSADARRTLGEHYTTETNILKTINPLFMDELQQKFAMEYHSKSGLKRLRKEIGELRIMDPACGCGNFLVVAYRELRALDLKILERLQQLGDTTLIPTLYFERSDLPVTLDHFYGIEIEEWPARIATTALHLVDHQANQAMELALGKAPESLPLQTLSSIKVGNALRTDWREILMPTESVRVIGNPPFVGARLMSSGQKADVSAVWGAKSGDLDYVTCWFNKASDYFRGIQGGRFAFVSTNSISQGVSVASLFSHLFDEGWRIRFAHQTFAWTSEAAGMAHVHCVITGFDRMEKVPAVLYEYEDINGAPTALPAKQINGYLFDGPNVLIRSRTTPLSPSLPSCRFGSMANDNKGSLLVGAQDYASVSTDPIAKKYLRRFVQARELIHGTDRWCLWMAGDNFDPRDIEKSPILRQRVAAVRAARAESKRAATQRMAGLPYLFQEDRQPTVSYVAIPRHFSESRPFATVAYFDPDVICGDANFTVEDPDGFLFGVLSSSMFICWQRTVGGRIKSDLRFSKDIVWNNFPLPDVSRKMRTEIQSASQEIIYAREIHSDWSLADHYNSLAMTPALLRAHDTLDRLVDKAFGATRAIKLNEERRDLLFKRYAEMVATLM